MNETDVGREGTGEPLTQQESEAMTRVLGWYGSMRGTYVLFYQEVDDLRLAGYAALQGRLEAAEADREIECDNCEETILESERWYWHPPLSTDPDEAISVCRACHRAALAELINPPPTVCAICLHECEHVREGMAYFCPSCEEDRKAGIWKSEGGVPTNPLINIYHPFRAVGGGR